VAAETLVRFGAEELRERGIGEGEYQYEQYRAKSSP